MVALRETEQRPRLGTEGDAQNRLATYDQSTELAARARRAEFGVRVLAERRDGVVVAQVYSDLPAAERKVSRTRERGLRAELHLVRLVPVSATTTHAPVTEPSAWLRGVGARRLRRILAAGLDPYATAPDAPVIVTPLCPRTGRTGHRTAPTPRRGRYSAQSEPFYPLHYRPVPGLVLIGGLCELHARAEAVTG